MTRTSIQFCRYSAYRGCDFERQFIFNFKVTTPSSERMRSSTNPGPEFEMMFKDALEIGSGSEYNWLAHGLGTNHSDLHFRERAAHEFAGHHCVVDGFHKEHAKALQLKLEGSQAGFGRRIREPTINRPGLALAGSTSISRKNGSRSWARPSSRISRACRLVSARRGLGAFASKIPCLVASRGFHLAPDLLAIAGGGGDRGSSASPISMKFINAASIALEPISPRLHGVRSMVDIPGRRIIRGASGVGKSECVLG